MMGVQTGAFYPTPAHEAAAAAIVERYQKEAAVDAVLLVNSCARGKATPDSCLDINVLVTDWAAQAPSLEQDWATFYQDAPVFRQLEDAGLYAEVHLDFHSGQFTLSERDHTGGPDMFEVEIGNFCAYSFPIWERGDAFQQIKARWLPYYAEDLRQERLAQARYFCLNNLDHIAPYAARGLTFQCFARLYDVLHEFLQALFISRRTYPLIYDKWIHEQVVDILELPDLYPQLEQIIAVERLDAAALVQRAEQLRELLAAYTA